MKKLQELSFQFLKNKLCRQTEYWESSKNHPEHVLYRIKYILTNSLVRDTNIIRQKSAEILFFKTRKKNKISVEPDVILTDAWKKSLNNNKIDPKLLLNQFSNHINTIHFQRYGPKAKPRINFLKKASNTLTTCITNGTYPFWNRIHVTGVIISKPVKFSFPFPNIPQVTKIEFKSIEPNDLDNFFVLPWDTYKIPRNEDFHFPSSLLINYFWCEIPQNIQSTIPHATCFESITAQKFNHLLMTISSLIADGDIMARKNYSLMSSNGPIDTPNSITTKYAKIGKDILKDFLLLIDTCNHLSNSKNQEATLDWLTITHAISTLKDARFTKIGLHSRFTLAISCIEGLITRANESISKEELGERCQNIIQLINIDEETVKNNIVSAYKRVRSKFVHGHRALASKEATDIPLLEKIERYARQVIVIACFLSKNVRLGDCAKKFPKYPLNKLLNESTQGNTLLNQILLQSICPDERLLSILK